MKSNETKQSPNPHVNHRQRMRQRVIKEGLENMQDHEVLEYLLYPFIPRKDTNPIAHELIALAGNLEKVFDSSPEILLKVKNMTSSAAVFLTSMPQIIKKYNIQKLGDKPLLDTTAHATEYFTELIGREQQEYLCVAILNSKGMLIDMCRMTNGKSGECQMDIKKFVLKAASSQGDCIIVAHNHPSGNAEPSIADCDFTKWLISVTEVLGLKLLDHIIVCRKTYYSFKDSGELENYVGALNDYRNYSSAMDKFRI